MASSSISNASISLQDDNTENERNLFFLPALMLTKEPASYQLPEDPVNDTAKNNKYFRRNEFYK
jgi:hypothetical protein